MLDVPLLIGGQACPARDGRTFERRNPVTGEVVSRVAAATLEDADAAVAAAHAAFPAWNGAQFTNPSFTASTSGAALSGAYNAGDIGNNPFVTLYSYDALGNLYCVEQHGDSAGGTACPATPPGPTDPPIQPDPNNAWRRRLFANDSLSRLRWASNPESGDVNRTGGGANSRSGG